MLIADWVANYLKNQGIERLFVYPGGTIAPLIDSCLKVGIKYECFKSEQGAGFAGLAYSRLKKVPQVVMVTSGPGVTNVITPLADAFYDSVPLIVITGQISSLDLQARKEVRQRGFQETPTVQLTQSITKKSTCLIDEDTVFKAFPEAFSISVDGRKGPVVLDFPMNIQRTEILNGFPAYSEKKLIKAECSGFPETDLVSQIAQAMHKSKRPVILLGHGALNSGKYSEFVELAEKTDALVVSSLLGMGAYDTHDSRFMGYIGHTGHLSANKAVHQADFLLVLGARLDVRQTGTVTDQFVPNGEVAWIDADLSELNSPRVKTKWKVNCAIEEFLPELLKSLPKEAHLSERSWMEHIKNIKDLQIEDRDYSSTNGLFPKPVLSQLSLKLRDIPYTLVTGVGCHQHWAARHLPLSPNKQTLLTSAGHGTMGYDLPAAIGASMASPGQLVLCVVGDGSLLMNIQELASIKERRLNIKILVMNNRRLGIVSQFQKMNWGSDPTTGDFAEVNFSEVAKSFGIVSDKLTDCSKIEEKVNWLIHYKTAALLEVMIDPKADILPMLLAGQTMDKMWMGYQE